MKRKHKGGITSLVLRTVDRVQGVQITNVVADEAVQDFDLEIDTNEHVEDYTTLYAHLWYQSKDGKTWQN